MKETKLILCVAIAMAVSLFDFGESSNFRPRVSKFNDSEISTLKRNLNHRNCGSISIISSQKSADRKRVHELTAQVNDLLKQILTCNCIKKTESSEFAAAEEKLKQFEQNHEMVAYIVNKGHNNRSENIRLLSDFGESLASKQVTIKVYKPLPDTISANTVNNDIDEIIGLLRSMDTKFINQSNKLRDTIKIVLAILTDAIIDNKLTTKLNEELYTVDSKSFYDAITIAMDSIYGKVSTTHILDYIRRFEYLSHGMDGYAALFYQMRKNSSNLYTDEMVELAFHIQEYQMQANYANVVWAVRGRFEKLRDDLPKSLAALAFSDSVCIKNVKYNEYLFAGRVTRDSDRRYAFTWKPGNQVCQASWQIKREHGKLTIKNVNHNEYLFFSSYYDDPPSGIYTWIPNEYIPQDSWRIESTPDGVRIQNWREKSLYIAAIDQSYQNTERRYVVAAKEDQRYSRNDHWELEECNFKCSN